MEWQHILWSALGIIVTALVSWLVHRLTAFLNAKIKDAEALKLLNEALDIISGVVKSTYQTYVEELKNKDAFDESAQKTALEAAVKAAETKMSDGVKKYITENFGELTSWIEGQIESTLYDLKKDSKSVESCKNKA